MILDLVFFHHCAFHRFSTFLPGQVAGLRGAKSGLSRCGQRLSDAERRSETLPEHKPASMIVRGAAAVWRSALS